MGKPEVCEDEAGNFCTKNKKKCNKADVQERCPVTCDLCPEELTTTQEPINPTTEVTGSSPTTSSGTTTQEPNKPNDVCEDEAGNFCTKNKKKCNKADVQERCPVTCDLCHEELTTTQEPINPTTEVTGSS